MDDDRVIAIDGEFGVGKTTLGHALSDHLQLPFWDTGLTFRALAYACQCTVQGVPRSDLVQRLTASPYGSNRQELRFFDGVSLVDELWTPGLYSSLLAVASDESCRTAVCQLHRRVVVPPAIVAGRDVGSAVFPGAALKVVLTADHAVRQERRQRQDLDGVLRTQLEPTSLRDSWGPVRSENEILRIRTDDLTAEDVFHIVLEAVERLPISWAP